jgi:hypothetical protein
VTFSWEINSMIRTLLRRVTSATAAATLLASFAFATVHAAPAPVDGVWYSCQTKSAGYSPVWSPPDDANWEWDGRLQWEICIAQTSKGTHYAIVRLSAPADLVNKYDRYTGVSHFYLQKCVSGTYTTVAQKDWGVEQYAVGTKSGGRYQFTWLQTPSTTSSATSYRLRIVTVSGAVVPRNGGFIFSLEPDGFYPYPGNEGIYTSSCLNP